MDHDKLQDFLKISAIIATSLDGLLHAQSLLVELLCKECEIPLGMKEMIIMDMNNVIGVKKL